MKQRAFTLITGLAFAIGLGSAPAQAQANRTFVSGHGSDSNPCSLAAPCRNFQRAHDQTNAGGEITILDPAGYGPVTINRAISIVNDGVGEAGVTATTGTAIFIQVGASDVVNLRGLTLVGGGVGTNGIQFGAGKALNVQNCKIGGFTSFGIQFQPAANANASISDTVVSGNNVGILIKTTSGSSVVSAALKRVEVSDNTADGVSVDGSFSTGVLRVTIADSIANNNGATGFISRSAAAHAVTTLVVTGSQAVNNVSGVGAAGANATALVGRTTVSGNANGWFGVNAGVLNSYGDNFVDGNTGSEAAMPLIAQK